MQNEKIAITALAIIIIGALSIFLAATYGEDILDNIFPEEKTIEIGDCADVNFNEMLANGTVSHSSYTYPENKTGGTPLNIFITMNQSEAPPTEYPQYLSGLLIEGFLIEGFMEGLIGLKEGETATIGPIPPEKAYGSNKLGVGDTFSSSIITASNYGNEFNMTVEVTSPTDESMILKWLNVDDLGKFTTMPEAIIMENLENAYYTIYDNLPPYYLWENSSEIINITDETVEIKTTPTKIGNLTEELTFITIGTKVLLAFPDAATAEWNDTTITIISSPEIGNYSMDYLGTPLSIIITNITDTHIHATIVVEGEGQYFEFNKTIEFNRTYSMRRLYNIQLEYQIIFQEEIENAGFSMHELAGEELTFEVTIEKVYKKSQEN